MFRTNEAATESNMYYVLSPESGRLPGSPSHLSHVKYFKSTAIVDATRGSKYIK